MRFLRRRRRRIVDPRPFDASRLDSPPPASIERFVEEGMLIVESAVRMTVRNAIVLLVLRDHRDFDSGVLRSVARDRLLDLADEEDEAARRVGQRGGGNPDERGVRLVALHLGVAETLRERAADAEFVEGILRQARDAALEDIASTMMTAPVERTPDYDRYRADRIASFVGLDLTELAAQRGVDLMEL
ncbi:MAG: hypothetical protein QOJ18_693 [Microbacteriaceae bacterium]|nr:hypothetical protein [Microbacteriaceae bacterium]